FLGIVPENLVAAGLDLEESAAGAVGFGDQHLVINNDWIGGINAFKILGPPGEVEINFSGLRLEGDQSAAGEDKAPAPALDGRQHRARVAGQLIGDLVFHLAGHLVEGDDAAAVALQLGEIAGVAPFRTAAHLHDEQVSLDDRRTADAKEILNDVELLPRIDFPDEFAVVEANAIEHAFRPEDVDAILVDHGTAARAVVVVVLVLV